MRIRLCDRSLDQLSQVMWHLNESNATHTVQKMITAFLESLQLSSPCEDKNDNQKTKGVQSL